MPGELVRVRRSIPAPPDAVWRVLRAFCDDWHPDIDWCRAANDARGAIIREFEGSDGGLYRERLTWLSDSDRTLGYEHLSGIDGVASYRARVQVDEEGEERSRVDWTAEIHAPGKRQAEIANATREIFARGLDRLERALPVAAPVKPIAEHPAAKLTRRSLGAGPALSVLTGPVQQGEVLVLCLHGIGGNAENWRPQLEAFSGHFPMAAMDMRGYGRSEPGPRQSTIEDYCGDILEIADAFGAGRLVLVGLSMGSWIATSFAMRHPERLAGLVLAGGCTGMSEAPAEERERFRAAREVPLAQGRTPGDFAPEVVDLLAGPMAGAELREALRASMAAIPGPSYRDALSCFASPVERFDFRRISCPVLLMTGEHDRLAPPDEIRGVAQRIHDTAHYPDVRFEVLANAGHVCNLENRAAFDACLGRFLHRVVPSSGKRTREDRRKAKEHRILDAALAEFCASGYDGASMTALARRARVSKPTLYQYFGNKQGLFSAVLEQGRAHIIAPLTRDSGSLVDRLWDFSWTYAEFVLRPEMLSLARLILGEAERHPESAVAYHRGGPGRAFAGIVEFVEGRVAAGQLEVDDVELAAQDLWSLILSGPRDHHLHHVKDRPDAADMLRSIRHGLSVFIRVYSTNPDSDLAELEARTSRRSPPDWPPSPVANGNNDP